MLLALLFIITFFLKVVTHGFHCPSMLHAFVITVITYIYINIYIYIYI